MEHIMVNSLENKPPVFSPMQKRDQKGLIYMTVSVVDYAADVTGDLKLPGNFANYLMIMVNHKCASIDCCWGINIFKLAKLTNINIEEVWQLFDPVQPAH